LNKISSASKKEIKNAKESKKAGKSVILWKVFVYCSNEKLVIKSQVKDVCSIGLRKFYALDWTKSVKKALSKINY